MSISDINVSTNGTAPQAGIDKRDVFKRLSDAFRHILTDNTAPTTICKLQFYFVKGCYPPENAVKIQ